MRKPLLKQQHTAQRAFGLSLDLSISPTWNLLKRCRLSNSMHGGQNVILLLHSLGPCYWAHLWNQIGDAYLEYPSQDFCGTGVALLWSMPNLSNLSEIGWGCFHYCHLLEWSSWAQKYLRRFLRSSSARIFLQPMDLMFVAFVFS